MEEGKRSIPGLLKDWYVNYDHLLGTVSPFAKLSDILFDAMYQSPDEEVKPDDD